MNLSTDVGTDGNYLDGPGNRFNSVGQGSADKMIVR